MTTNQVITELTKPVHSRLAQNLPIDLDVAVSRIESYAQRYIGGNLQSVDWEKVAYELVAI